MAVGVFGICGMLDGEFGEWLVRGRVFLYNCAAVPYRKIMILPSHRTSPEFGLDG